MVERNWAGNIDYRAPFIERPETIDTKSFWDGTSSVGFFGGSGDLSTGVYGETFTSPGDAITSLDSDGGTGGHFKLAVNMPISDTLAIRMVGYATKYAGFIDALKSRSGVWGANVARMHHARQLHVDRPLQ